jgi:hypothetical protein
MVDSRVNCDDASSILYGFASLFRTYLAMSSGGEERIVNQINEQDIYRATIDGDKFSDLFPIMRVPEITF